MKTCLVSVKNIQKSFGEKEVLKGISFKLYKGENLAILGRSGSGKSVLLKMLVGLIEPDEGDILVLGKQVSRLKEEELTELRKRIGYLFQEGALYDSMTVGENVGFALKRKATRKTDTEIEKLVEQSLEKVGLKETADKMPDELSGGMKKRVALARTIILKPDIILYDEPTSGLDSITSREISGLIIAMKNDLGISSIIATHDLASAGRIADRVMVLHRGRILAEGSFQKLSLSREPEIHQFFKV